MEVSSYRRCEFWYVADQYSLPGDQILCKLVTKAKYMLRDYIFCCSGLDLLMLEIQEGIIVMKEYSN